MLGWLCDVACLLLQPIRVAVRVSFPARACRTRRNGCVVPLPSTMQNNSWDMMSKRAVTGLIELRTSDALDEPRTTVRKPPWKACPM